ncbi:DUF1997 domain-containing protein [Mastigocoleus testarum]|uniref:DUF1997 domain-containing protein n=1 Tax=Mastigocoleus testarum BC008 TaxID=371196 RepID=A0A0V7ZIB3_9CYAN|nr:DUF1997 domain-containing protein [Mastigocoleus testarum]KST62279.1 hypothetical protein BC008_08895 [Mastigocoleus testarum BC008]KST64124.1 hypothetical protein BC008_15890 [Mastigocoleus testarum BC008]
MLSKNREHQFQEKSNIVYSAQSNFGVLPETTEELNFNAPTEFCGHYSDCMKMSASAESVAEYLDNHASWFVRCALPMKVQPLGDNGYALVIGRFGSFGYELEPKIGLELLPQEQGIYRIRTIPIPGYDPMNYDVDYRASLQLFEDSVEKNGVLEHITRVEWELDLKVYIQFPKFIQRLPKSLVKSTGDKLLNQIVRQVSRRLTRKVQEDFHQNI